MEGMVTAKYSNSEVTTGDVFVPQQRKLTVIEKVIRNEAKKSKRKNAKGSEKTFYQFRETKRKGSETISVSLRFASKRKKIKSENGTPYSYIGRLLNFRFRNFAKFEENLAKHEIKIFAKLRKLKFCSHPTPTQSAVCYSPSPPVCQKILQCTAAMLL